jgi:malonyl-CoA O-methyltransferase
VQVSSEFSKYAKDYSSYNIIQNKVIEKLLSHIDNKPQNILDLGCGNGGLYAKIDWKLETFIGVDFAPGMLELHPKAKGVECIYGDFNDSALFTQLQENSFDQIFSASALQWAQDLESVFANIAKFESEIALALFTSNTFKTLNQTASLHPILRSSKEIYELQKKYFDADFEIVEYKLEFDSVRDMFRYIKKSGVSASRKVLSYKQTKELIRDYPVNYLEFEVVFITSRSK